MINDLRVDLELGTSYKIDSIKIANHFMTLKLALIDWTVFPEINVSSIYSANDIESVVSMITDPIKQQELKAILNEVVTDTVDAALVMTVVPACESLEDATAIERNRIRFENYNRCACELERMKLVF